MCVCVCVCECAAAPLLELLVRIPPGAWMSVVSVVCCKVEVSASNRTLVQRIPTECDVSEYDREDWIMKGPWPTGAVTLLKKTDLMLFLERE